MQWIDDTRFVIGETRFLSSGDHDWNDAGFLAVFAGADSTTDRFVIWKSRSIIDRYVELVARLQPRNIFELGIMKGGSTAFLDAIAQPETLVAVEIATEPVDALDQYIDRNDRRDRLKTYYDVDQKDRETLFRILDSDFAGRSLDLVIDDASHRLEETRASFNVLFPALRPGGVYVIEDWSWAHALDAIDLGDIGPPLTNLIFEVVIACATWRDVIASVEIDWGVAYITRGLGEIDSPFDVANPLSQTAGPEKVS